MPVLDHNRVIHAYITKVRVKSQSVLNKDPDRRDFIISNKEDEFVKCPILIELLGHWNFSQKIKTLSPVWDG